MNRPAIEICAVTRGPFVPIGSLMTWTMRVSPRFSSSATFGRRRRERLAPVPPPPPPVPPRAVCVLVVVIGRRVFVVRLDQVRGMKKGALFRPDVDERGLDPRKHGFHRAEVDVAHAAAGVGTIDQELNKAVVL